MEISGNEKYYADYSIHFIYLHGKNVQTENSMKKLRKYACQPVDPERMGRKLLPFALFGYAIHVIFGSGMWNSVYTPFRGVNRTSITHVNP